jgi:hypothetical protein
MAYKGSGPKGSQTAADRRAGDAGAASGIGGGRGLGGSGGSRNGNNQGGMSTSLMNSKYPGMKGKKNRQYELSAENIAKVGTIAAGMLGGPVGTAISAGYSAVDSALSGTNPISGALDPFSGRGPDVPSAGAGYADGTKKDDRMSPADLLAAKKNGLKKAKTKLSPGFTLLSGAGGTLLGS